MKTYKERAVDLVVAFYAQLVNNYDEFYGFISDDENWEILYTKLKPSWNY